MSQTNSGEVRPDTRPASAPDGVIPNGRPPPPADAPSSLPAPGPPLRWSGASRVDVRLATIVAMSFLVHFGFVGAFYSDWMDSVVDEDVTARFIDTLVRSPDARWVESPELPVVATGDPAVAPSGPAQPTPSQSAHARGVTPGDRRRAVADLLEEAHQLEVGVIGLLAAGPNVDRALARGEGARVDLDALANRSEGVTNRLGPPRGAGDSGPIRPGREAWPPLLVGSPPVASTAGPPRKIAPTPVVERLPFASSAPVSNAEATIRSQIEPGARRCYQRGLQVDPDQAGKVVIAIRVGESGEVDAASAMQSKGLSAAVVDCIVEVARRAVFDRPAGGAALLSVPFNFVKQG